MSKQYKIVVPKAGKSSDDGEMALYEAGTVVTADDDYLYTSIKEPGAMKRRGAVGIMPSNKLTDQEIASIIAYIRALK